MKKSGILNTQINYIIAQAKHGNKIMITDAGFPIPRGKFVADVSIVKDFPSMIQILEPLFQELIYEEVVVASEQMTNNPIHYQNVCALAKRCPVTLVDHATILNDMANDVDYFIRTGAFEPWGNVIITSGLDAAKWFDKEAIIVPESYKDRVNYKD